MQRIVWLTDIHLNFMNESGFAAFLRTVARHDPDVILVGGDLGEAPSVASYLEIMAREIGRPLYFVLGNHDYYHGSIAEVREAVLEVCRRSPLLTWLSTADVVNLSSQCGLIGHGGWADGCLGDYQRSDVLLNDYFCIAEFLGLDLAGRLNVMRQLASEAVEHIARQLPLAFAKNSRVFLLTHVPPFKEACWHEGRISDDNWLPHFTCKMLGDTIVDFMRDRPDHQLTVLCGHTHGGGESQILPNVKVLTGAAQYGHPRINRIMEINGSQ